MFENKIIRGVHSTRYISSWLNEGGSLTSTKDRTNFAKWLITLGLNKEEVSYILRLLRNGKLELEYSARKFMKTLNEED